MTYFEAGTYYFVAGSKMEDRVLVPGTGVSVQVAYWAGTEYIDDTASPMTAPGTVYTRQVRMRLISDGVFAFDDKEMERVSN